MLNMQAVPLLTADGSYTFELADGVIYHSRHGAVGESKHIYIEGGLYRATDEFQNGTLRILETGFGTGLNVLLSIQASRILQRDISYTSLELFPLDPHLIESANYPEATGHKEDEALFSAVVKQPYDSDTYQLITGFQLAKQLTDITTFEGSGQHYHLVYFDVFAPRTQPELWTSDVFRRISDAMIPGGILMTYCSKVVVQRAMREAGFLIEKIPGPWGKREILRVRKPVIPG